MSKYREWTPGSNVKDQHGFHAQFLAYWDGHAWIVYHGQQNPVTVPAWTLELLPEQPAKLEQQPIEPFPLHPRGCTCPDCR